MVKKSVKGTTIQKKGPKQTSITDRRERVLHFSNVEDILAEIREEFYDNKAKSKIKRENQGKVPSVKATGKTFDEKRKKNSITSGMSTSEATKVLAEKLKQQLKS